MSTVESDTATNDVGPWSPLRVTIFRSLWIAGLVSNLGTFMHLVAVGWAITSLTSSPTVVSLAQAAWTVPGFLLALLAGAFADVVDRRRLIIVTQACSMVCAAVLGSLELSGRLTVTELLVLTFLLSSAMTMSAPAFMALTPELVERDQLPAAIGLNSISSNIAQSLGPALAGIVIAASGPGAVFLVNAVSFLGIVIVVRAYHPAESVPLPAEHIVAAMRTGAAYFLNSPRLQVLAARVVLALTATSALSALLPIIARKQLHASAGQFGLLSTAMGVGAVAAVWLLPRVNRRTTPDVVVIGASLVWAVGAATFAWTHSMPVALLGLTLAGAGTMATMNVVFSMYTTLLPAWVRGRASSVAMLVVWLGASVGAVGWGTLGSAVGVRSALAIAALAHIVATAIASVVLRLGTREPPDITPIVWAMPEPQVAPGPADGPVLVTIEWRIDPANAEQFTAAMAPIRRMRRRDGATGWGLFHDIEDPGRVLETFTVATWAEHERQHHRSVAGDAATQQPARSLVIDDGPHVRHLITHTTRPSTAKRR